MVARRAGFTPTPGQAEHRTYRGERREHAHAVAIGEHVAAPVRGAIERAGRRDLEALHAARERDRIVGLDHELDPVRVHGDLHDAEVRTREGHGERAAECRIDARSRHRA